MIYSSRHSLWFRAALLWLGCAGVTGAATTNAYRIAHTDLLRVAIFEEDQLTQIARVNAVGDVTLPLVGAVNVVGLSLDEAADRIRDRYQEQRILRSPEVTVTIEEYSAREIKVMGEVNQPGSVGLVPDREMTLLDAIIKAGGFTDQAKSRAVKVTRNHSDGSQVVTVVDVRHALEGGKRRTKESADLLLQPDDIVYVPLKFM
jgi:polysaccharide export outer membrane protein